MWVLVAWASVLSLGQAARAQSSPEPSSLQMGSGDIAITLDSFGVGGVVRPGSLASVRLNLRDRGAVPRDVVVQLAIDDGDRDTVNYTREVTLTPGADWGVWIHARMPWDLGANAEFLVSVREAVDAGDGVLLAGAELGLAKIRPQRVEPAETAMFAVIGARSDLGLREYNRALPTSGALAAAHEPTQTLAGLSTGQLPDRWYGLEPFSVIVWAGADPTDLTNFSTQQAEALIEWVNRGGHLFIVLERVGSNWFSGQNPVASLLPAVEVDRFPAADLNDYREALTMPHVSRGGRLPDREIIHAFTPIEGAEQSLATPLMVGPHGDVVVRRLVGNGMVTLCGIDIAQRDVAQVLSIERFWNRMLGRRVDHLDGAELAEARSSASARRAAGVMHWVDLSIASSIAKSRAASLGVLLALIVFVVYWVLVGQTGFYFLRSKGWERHSWLLFVASAALFTFVSWTAVSAMKPGEVRMWHHTTLQRVYGQPTERSRVFASVLLPDYGEQAIAVGEPGVDEQFRQSLTPWEDPGADIAAPFPDSRAYALDARAMIEFDSPARSTTKQVQIEYLGGPRWETPGPVSPDDAPRFEGADLVGRLVHNLPGALTDVRILVIERPTTIAEQLEERARGELQAIGSAYALGGAWAPGAELDLGSIWAPADPASNITRLLESLVPKTRGAFAGVADPLSIRSVHAVPLFPVLQPPDYTERPTTSGSIPAVLSRRLTHGMDLGPWFTQACVIVLGRIEGAPCPAPVRVDGRRIHTAEAGADGVVELQWVYPLSPRPFAAGSDSSAGARSRAPHPIDQGAS